MADAVVPYLGWGSLSQAWNTGTWNTDTNSIIPVATGAFSASSVTGDANFTITTTDIVATGTVNGVTVTGDANIPIEVTGAGATAIVGVGFVWGLNLPSQDPNWQEIAA